MSGTQNSDQQSMTPASEQMPGQVSGVRAGTGVLNQDVGCPGCGYNLRGLGSDVATCPECGLESDVAQLLIRRWDKPWYRAPKFNQICSPAAVGFIALFGWVLSWSMAQASMRPGPLSLAMTLFWLAAGVVGWGLAFAWVYNKLDGMTSVGFALLAHVPLVGYLGGMLALLGGLLSTVLWLVEATDLAGDPEPIALVVSIAVTLAGIGALWLARWIEKVVAQHCIRLYLRRPTTSG